FFLFTIAKASHRQIITSGINELLAQAPRNPKVSIHKLLVMSAGPMPPRPHLRLNPYIALNPTESARPRILLARKTNVRQTRDASGDNSPDILNPNIHRLEPPQWTVERPTLQYEQLVQQIVYGVL